ncbi:MAG TPA: ABC transporter permease [Pyrinomonadaceae bacterium]|nr:ABC transporter permease [Pyrinomonadaceae bacterium]
MVTLFQDVRYGARMLAKRPGFTLVAVVALALGIGANTAIFSVVNSVLLRPLPYPESERLVQLAVANASTGARGGALAYLDFLDWQREARTFEAMAAYTGGSGALTGDGSAPEQLAGVATTPDLFKVLGVSPVIGRTFTAEEAARASRPEKAGEEGEQEEQAAPVIVISHGLWQRRFGGDPSVVGKTVTFNNKAVEIIGVMPEGFRYPLDYDNVEFWGPFNASNPYAQHRGASFLEAVGKLKPGVSVEQGAADLFAVSERLAEEHAQTNRTRRADVRSLHETLVGDIRPALLVLLAAVGCVLLIACANVANLLLARAAARQKEFAIRTALGASRWRIARQLLTESVLLSLAAGAVGLLFTMWGVDLLMAVAPDDVPRLGSASADARVLLFTLGVSLLTGLAFGLAPALQATRTDLSEPLKEGERGSTAGRGRLHGALVVAEVALSLILLVGAGLLVKSFQRLTSVNPGFNPDGVLTATMTLSGNRYKERAEQREAFRRAFERAAAAPGVEAVGGIYPLPLSGNDINTNFTIDNRSFEDREHVYRGERKVISHDFLRAMRVPIVRGRGFTERDDASAPPVFIINETLARKYFSGEEAIGRLMSMRDIEGVSTGEIVGVVADVKYEGLGAEAEPAYYVPYLQKTYDELALVVRAREGLEPASLAPVLRAAVLEADKDQPLSEVRTMRALLSNSVARERFQVLLLGVFASVALVLSAVGLFGVLSYSVTQRRHEIGIRMALGAQARDIFRLVVGRGMGLTLVGLGLGLVGSLLLTRLMTGLLFGVSATDPVTFAAVTALLALVAFFACYLPARRAMRVDPMTALRHE